MNQDFLNDIFEKHQNSEKYPPTSLICKFTTRTLLVLFPEQSKQQFKSADEVRDKFKVLEADLSGILNSMRHRLDAQPESVAKSFFDKLPGAYGDLQKDIQAIIMGDPAATSEYEVIRAYPGFYAIAFYRLAHILHELNVPLLPRVMTEYAHSKTGIDIHPAAKIQPYFCIDHGTGIVIGETTEIGKHVKIYQSVTLGALSVEKRMAKTKRHPTIEDNVVIYSGATILGGETVIGKNSVVGGNVWLTKSIPADTTVYHQAQIKVHNEE